MLCCCWQCVLQRACTGALTGQYDMVGDFIFTTMKIRHSLYLFTSLCPHNYQRNTLALWLALMNFPKIHCMPSRHHDICIRYEFHVEISCTNEICSSFFCCCCCLLCINCLTRRLWRSLKMNEPVRDGRMLARLWAGIGESASLYNKYFLIKFTATKFFSHIVYLGKRMSQQVAAGRPTKAYLSRFVE